MGVQDSHVTDIDSVITIYIGTGEIVTFQLYTLLRMGIRHTYITDIHASVAVNISYQMQLHIQIHRIFSHSYFVVTGYVVFLANPYDIASGIHIGEAEIIVVVSGFCFVYWFLAAGRNQLQVQVGSGCTEGSNASAESRTFLKSAYRTGICTIKGMRSRV